MEQESQKITLTLNPEAAAETPAPSEQPAVSEVHLTPEEQKTVDEFAKQIDITDTDMILHYGANAQNKISDFSSATLENVKTKDMGEVGNLMTNLIAELKSIDEDDDKGFSFFKKSKDKVSNMKTRYNKVEKNVDDIVKLLEQHQITLIKDIAMLDEMYKMNLTNFKELSMYIIAGQQRLKEAREVELEQLKQKAIASGLAEDSQAANDFAASCDRFEKKLYDLQLTRNVALQMGPQIRLIQNNDVQMSDKIQSTIVNTIPLWRSQLVLALGLQHSADAMQAQNAVSEMTNSLLKKNAETLKQGSLNVARESERGIIDIETLKQTNQSLISTLDEVLKIQADGKAKRESAQQDLIRIENELKQRLLDIR